MYGHTEHPSSTTEEGCSQIIHGGRLLECLAVSDERLGIGGYINDSLIVGINRRVGLTPRVSVCRSSASL